MLNGTLAYEKSFLKGLTPEPMLTVSEWAEQYRWLSSKGSAEPGRFRVNRTPYLREPMDCLSTRSPFQRVVMQFGAQLGKTESGNNWIGYVVSTAPGPILAVQPTLEMAKRLSKQRLEDLFTETPVLAELVGPARSRDSGNSMLQKSFPSGLLVVTGSNSPTGLRSMPCRYIFLDEVDAYPADTGEGDPIQLAERRTNTFARRKILITSTPTVKDFSRIEREFLRSDQRFYEVPCPCCGHFQRLIWNQMKWESNDPSTAMYECESCGERFPEHFKSAGLSQGRWTPTSQGDGVTAGFQLSSLYSPLGWRSWPEIVDDFLRSKNDPTTLQVWVNTTLGESFEDSYAAKLSAEGLLKRALEENYPRGTVPKGGLLLVGACDVQDSWLETSIWAFGVGEEAWLVWHQKIEGTPADAHVWEQLDQIRHTRFKREGGGEMSCVLMAVDTGGHFTSEAYQYTRSRGAGVVGIKGSSNRNSPPINKGNKIDCNWNGKTIKKGMTLYSVGVHALKSTVYGRLKMDKREGAGCIHFGQNGTAEFLQGLTCERLVLRHVKGFAVREWVKPSGARNEPLDLIVYSLAALQLIYRRFNRATMWQQLADNLNQQSDKPQEPRQAKRRRSFGVGSL